MVSLRAVVGDAVLWIIRTWIRWCGTRIAKRDVPWLHAPVGLSRMGPEFYTQLAQREQLQLLTTRPVGLLASFAALRGPTFDPDAIHPKIRHFYEHSSRYALAAESYSPWPMRFLLWALVTSVSRHMNQLNLPLTTRELQAGMTNEVLPLVDASGERIHTGWLRTNLGTGRVVYAGLYAVGTPGGQLQPCVRACFPVPHGSAVIFLRPIAQPDGSLRLSSGGTHFGDAGFYRLLEADAEHWYVRYLHTMREEFHLYVDEAGELHTMHTVSYVGMKTLQLHYQMKRL